MRLHHILLATSLLATPVLAQDAPPISKPSLDAALPAEVRAMLNNEVKVETLFAVDGSETFDGDVLKADVISFARNSELVLRKTDAPVILIAARDVKFPDADASYRIRFDDLAAPGGSDGLDGARGANGDGETNFKGHPGTSGAPGRAGQTGASRSLPTVYLLVGRFSVGDDPSPSLINLAFKFRGTTGGDGGRGGSGGRGGDGARGHKGSDGPFNCKHGAGEGGRGGDGGKGGAGGNGGRGGDGASLVFVSTPTGTSQFGYTAIMNQGGYGGNSGVPGRAGDPGDGGPGGHGSTFCGGGKGGPSGSRPAAATPGVDGARGNKGTVTMYSVPVLDLFD